jgi:DNA-3-methyladenine glycosylase
MLQNSFFNRDAVTVAKDLLGKVMRVNYQGTWLEAMIIETEAYYLHEKGSHSSLGFTEKRKALFMPAGTIYMYHAHGGDSLNVSCKGKGNAVLIKSGIPYIKKSPEDTLKIMHQLNPRRNAKGLRADLKLCSGQTLLCKSLGLKVKVWDQKNFDKNLFYFTDVGYKPKQIIQTTRLGIPKGRDEHLLLRFVDYDYAAFCTRNPLIKRGWKEGREFLLLSTKK